MERVKKNLINYKKCLIEIRYRIKVIEEHLFCKTMERYKIVETEVICLQFRKILENIVFASLSANVEKYKEKRKSYCTDWNISGIMKELKKLNNNFYPKPVYEKIIGKDSQGRNIYELIDYEGDYLSDDELIDYYSKLSNYMHESNPFSNKADLDKIREEYIVLLIKIKKLLNNHIVQVDDLLIEAFLKEESDLPEVWIFEDAKGRTVRK